MKILVVDDDELMRMTMVQALKSEGYDIEEGVDGADAIEKLKQGTYDIVVTDVVMPNQSGASVGEYIKKNKLHTAILVVSSFSNSDGGSPLDFANYFADDTLQKPFSKDALISAVKHLSPGINIESALQNM